MPQGNSRSKSLEHDQCNPVQLWATHPMYTSFHPPTLHHCMSHNPQSTIHNAHCTICNATELYIAEHTYFYRTQFFLHCWFYRLCLCSFRHCYIYLSFFLSLSSFFAPIRHERSSNFLRCSLSTGPQLYNGHSKSLQHVQCSSKENHAMHVTHAKKHTCLNHFSLDKSVRKSASRHISQLYQSAAAIW